MFSRVLAQNDLVGAQPHILGLHDLVGLPVRQHAMLVNAGFMSEGVRPHDRLVARRMGVGRLAQGPARRHDLTGVDAGRQVEHVPAGADRHDGVLQRAIARPFAYAIDRALDLTGAAAHGGQRVGDRHAQIIMTMSGEDHVRPSGDLVAEVLEQLVDLIRRRIAHRVWHVECGRPRFGGDGERFDQEAPLGADGVLGGEFHIVAMFTRQLGHLLDARQHVFGGHVQLELAMQRARPQKDVDALVGCGFQRPRRRIDIARRRARQRADGGPLDLIGDPLNGAEITRAGGGEAGLDHIHFQRLQGARDVELAGL